MKKTIIAITALLVAAPAFAKFLVGTVNIQNVLVTVKEGQDVRGQLEKAFNKKKDELQKGEDEIRKLQETYKKQGLVMNDETKKKKEEEIQTKLMELQTKSVNAQKEIAKMEEDFKRPILERITAITEEISKKESVEMTFEVSSSPIIYAKDSIDLTAKVVESYDKKYPAKK
jgi:outer membrane protein